MKGGINAVLNALMPVFFGAGMAFLVNPLVNQVEKRLKKLEPVKKHARGLGIVAAILVYGALIYVAVNMIFPQLVKTILGLVNELPGMMQRAVKWLEEQIAQNEQLRQVVDNIWKQINEKFSTWVEQDLMSTIRTTLVSVANGVFSAASMVINFASVLFNLVIGLIVMIYLLLGKNDFIGQSKKILYAVCRNKKIAAAVLDVAREANHIFNGFISGKLLDSLIVGIICFICLSLMKMPYTLLVSVIVGVTNIIPVFGPFIGAIPCAFLILLVNPMQCLVFIIFIIILQQVDGNILGPKILGDSTGLSAFWVTFAILLFGKLMGFAGMILGVPLFATFYYVVKRGTEALLRRRSLPTETKDYVEIDYIDEENGLHYLDGAVKSSAMRRKLRREGRKENDDRMEKMEEKASAVGTEETGEKGSAVGTEETEEKGSAVGTEETEEKGSAVGTEETAEKVSAVGTEETEEKGSAVGTEETEEKGSPVGTEETEKKASAVRTEETAGKASAEEKEEKRKK